MKEMALLRNMNLLNHNLMKNIIYFKKLLKILQIDFGFHVNIDLCMIVKFFKIASIEEVSLTITHG